MKKIIFFVFCIILLANNHVYAQEHALNNYGYYSIKNAACVYNYNNLKINISFIDDTLSSISFLNSNSANNIYEGTISFDSFYDKKTKEFKCPEKLYIMYDVVNNRGNGQGYYIDLGYDEYNDVHHDILELLSNDSNVQYNEKKDSNNNIESYNVICKLKKVTEALGSSAIQYAAPMHLDYVEKSINKNVFVSDNNEYVITNGNFDCDETIKLNLIIDMDLKTIEISNCNNNVNQNCVVYERADYANSGYDSGINKDGSNNNSSELVAPSSVGFYSPKITEQECSSLLGSPDPKPNGNNDPAYYLTFAFKVIRYIAIIILIVLSTMDFLSAVSSHDDDELKKAMNKTIIRFVLCVIIFLLPTLIAFILRIIDKDAVDLCIDTLSK